MIDSGIGAVFVTSEWVQLNTMNNLTIFRFF